MQYEKEFIQLIRNRLGLLIKHHQLHDLAKTVTQACQKFDCTPQEYLSMLMNCREDSPWLEFLVTGITIGETYFFRDSHQMQLLRETILPTLIAKKRAENNLSLRIWSAGCASGEEIYTIAMLLDELLVDRKNWTLQLLGTDINTTSLKKAMEAVFGEWSMRSIPDAYRQQYFSVEAKKYHLHPEISQLVNFTYLNLGDETYPSVFNNTNAQDLILCRNVLIYFDENHIEHLMKKLDACLVEGAFLMLGASDPVQVKSTHLASWQREGSLLIHGKPEQKNLIRTVTQTVLPEKIISKKVIPKKTIDNQAAQVQEKDIISLMDEALWDQALAQMELLSHQSEHRSFILNARAVALANLGQLDNAIKACEESLARDAAQVNTWFTLAMILMEKNQVKDAESALRKALFLDHQFVAGHFQLGLLLIRNGQSRQGLKSLGNALAITTAFDPGRMVDGLKGMDYGRLTDILKHEIELYSEKESA